MQPIHRSSDQVRSRSQQPVVVIGSLLAAASTILVVTALTFFAQRSTALAAVAGLAVPAVEKWSHSSDSGLAPTGAALHTTADAELPSYGVSVGIVGYGAVNFTPSAPFPSGTVVSAVADPSPGYRFEGWSGAFDGSETPLTFTITSDLVLTATFVLDAEPRTYTVTSHALSGGTVAVTPPGPFAPGERVTLTAHPEANWRFVRWSGEINGSANPFSFAVIDDTDVVAVFEMESQPLTLTLTLANDGEGVVTADPPGPFAPGQTVTLTATPEQEWDFMSWGGHLSGHDNPLIMTIVTHTTAIARFQLDTEETLPVLTIEVNGGGEVIPDPTGPYHLGQLVQLRAVAQPGWLFQRWGGALSGDASPIAFPILGDTHAVAHFAEVAPTPVALAVHITGSGQVRRDPPGPYLAGQPVTITAVPAPGWQFGGWSGDLAGTANPHTFAIVEDLTVLATFAVNPPPDEPPNLDPPPDPEPDPEPPVEMPPPDNPPDDGVPNPIDPPTDTPAVEVSVAGAGNVERDPPGPYSPGQLITLTAQAESGWAFAGWSGSLTGQQNPHAAAVTATLAVTATFVPLTPPLSYQVEVNARGAGIVDLSPPGPYQSGQSVTLLALPAAGQCFQSWGGSLESTANPHIVLVMEHLAVTAQFEPCPLYLPLVQGRN
jgi:uncharacterized repeat protein (TIGR02543 family)